MREEGCSQAAINDGDRIAGFVHDCAGDLQKIIGTSQSSILNFHAKWEGCRADCKSCAFASHSREKGRRIIEEK